MPDHLAQVNIGLLRGPIDSPALAGFVAQLDPINALADAAPGFVWRLTTEGTNDATQIRPFQDELIAINLSVWTSFEALWNFVFRTAHLDVMRRRRDYFHRMSEPHLALWWVPVGAQPSVDEAVERLTHLRAHGPGPYAFTFTQPAPEPAGSAAGPGPGAGAGAATATGRPAAAGGG